MQLSRLHVVEMPFAGRRAVSGGAWPLVDYRRSGAYEAAGVAVSYATASAPDAMPADEDLALGAIGASIAEEVAAGLNSGAAVVAVGGNCHHATGVLGGLQEAAPDKRIGLVWFDAHGDFNTPATTLSGSTGGMPVAVVAGLAWPRWRVGSRIRAPLPIDGIVLMDGRNLDPPEARLARDVGLTIAAPASRFPGVPLGEAVAALAERVDVIYLHVDADILDIGYVPNHVTGEPDGPSIEEVVAAQDTVMATGLVAAYALVSVFTSEPGRDTSVSSAIGVLRGAALSWRHYGRPTLS